ncbi:MAG TPA: thioesterase family protein [Spirochaetota bacterium]|nr:thioesterase family protein [Spirochaetota bacterium]
MSRVKLKELQSYEFRSSLQVRITDINIANHLGHVELIGMMHEARHQFFTQLGVTELCLGADNVGIVIIDLVTNYLLEVFAGDIIDIDLQIDDMTERSFRVYYRLKRGDEIIALAETGIAPFIYGSKQAVPVPPAFTEALTIYREKK